VYNKERLDMTVQKNIVWHPHKVARANRQAIKKHKSCVLWLTGLPSSGKSTVANELDYMLNERGVHTYVLDGDNIRHGLNKNLGFSKEDRKENIRRIGEVAKLFTDAGVIAITAFISPFAEDRKTARDLMGTGEFFEIYIKCSVEKCMERDPKGLYKKAIAGEIKEFTGISQPYEAPENPELVIETDILSVKEAAGKIMDFLAAQKIII